MRLSGIGDSRGLPDNPVQFVFCPSADITMHGVMHNGIKRTLK